MDYDRLRRMLLPLLVFLAAGAAWEGLARYSGWSASVFPGPRGGRERDVGTHPERNPSQTLGSQSISCNRRILFGRYCGHPSGHNPGLVEDRPSSLSTP